MKKISVVAVGVLAWLASVALDLQFSFDFVGFFSVILIVLFCSIIMSIIGLMGMIQKRRSEIFGIGMIFLLFCISEMAASGYIAQYQKQRSFIQAEQIISALENFRKATGEYPSDINELVPSYLKNIPKTKMGWFGTPFNYYKMKDGGYRLSFDYRVFLIANYDSKKKSWFVDD